MALLLLLKIVFFTLLVVLLSESHPTSVKRMTIEEGQADELLSSYDLHFIDIIKKCGQCHTNENMKGFGYFINNVPDSKCIHLFLEVASETTYTKTLLSMSAQLPKYPISKCASCLGNNKTYPNSDDLEAVQRAQDCKERDCQYTFKLCDLDTSDRPNDLQECFDKHVLESQVTVSGKVLVTLERDLSCLNCLIQVSLLEKNAVKAAGCYKLHLPAGWTSIWNTQELGKNERENADSSDKQILADVGLVSSKRHLKPINLISSSYTSPRMDLTVADGVLEANRNIDSVSEAFRFVAHLVREFALRRAVIKRDTSKAVQEMNSTIVKTEQKMNSTNVKTEEEINSTNVKTEEEINSTNVRADQEMNSTNVKTEQEMNPTSVKTKEVMNSTNVKTEEMNSTIVKTEQEMNSINIRTEQEMNSTIKTEEEMNSTNLKTEQAMNSTNVKTEQEMNSINIRTEQEMNSTVKTEEEMNSTNVKTEQEMNSTNVKTEQEMNYINIRTEQEMNSTNVKTEQEMKSAYVKTEQEMNPADVTIKQDQEMDSDRVSHVSSELNDRSYNMNVGVTNVSALTKVLNNLTTWSEFDKQDPKTADGFSNLTNKSSSYLGEETVATKLATPGLAIEANTSLSYFGEDVRTTNVETHGPGNETNITSSLSGRSWVAVADVSADLPTQTYVTSLSERSWTAKVGDISSQSPGDVSTQPPKDVSTQPSWHETNDAKPMSTMIENKPDIEFLSEPIREDYPTEVPSVSPSVWNIKIMSEDEEARMDSSQTKASAQPTSKWVTKYPILRQPGSVTKNYPRLESEVKSGIMSEESEPKQDEQTLSPMEIRKLEDHMRQERLRLQQIKPENAGHTIRFMDSGCLWMALMWICSLFLLGPFRL